MNDAERATEADWAPYRARKRFNLFELACLLRGVAPERISNAVTTERIAYERAQGYGPTTETPESVRLLIDAMPEMMLGDIGRTLKALKTAANAQTMHVAVQVDKAQRIAAALGLSWPSELSPSEVTESPEDRRKRRLARFLELGGSLRAAGAGWHCIGRRGALAALVREEKRAGRQRSERQDVKLELVAAIEADQLQS